MKLACPYINGEWISSNREEEDIRSPYSGEVVGKKLISDSADVECAIKSAFEAKKEIAKIPSLERAKILKKASSLLSQNKEKFAALISTELGKPIKNTLDEVTRSAETLELSGEEAKRLFGETIPGDVSSRGTKAIASTYRVPVGVVAAITPFNAPLNLICHKIGPAFAAGNAMILKPAPQTSLVATELVKLLLEAGFPQNAINMVIGGAEAGTQIVSDKRVNIVSFTGGIKAGNSICNAAGMKKVLLELGGNAATIVHEDADLERAARICARTGFSNSGQSCISVQRIYVQNSVVKPFTELLKKFVLELKVGDPLSKESDLGSMVDEFAAKRVEEWIHEAVSMGAELVCGGTRKGATIQPTVLFNAPNRSKVVCEEVFGPVVTIVPYEKFDDALEQANDSDFGLQAGIFTNRIDLAHHAADVLEVGGVVINGSSNFRLDHWPYGGVKNSGIGREGPRFAIQEMTEMKMIVYQIS